MQFGGVGSSLFGLLLVSSAFGGDWPQFLGPTRDGTSPETGLVERLPEALPIVWRKPAGEGFAGPVVVGEALFHFHQTDGEERVEKLNVSDGKQAWSVGYRCDYQGGMFRELGPRATPLVSGGCVYTFGADGVLQCLACDDGKVVWRRKLFEDYPVRDSYFGAACSPAIEGDVVLLNVGSRKGAGLVGFDRHTGKTIWAKTDDEASYSSPVVATLAGKRTALFFARTGLHGVDPLTGEERFFFRWRARTDASVNAAVPLVLGDRVFISSSYDVGSTLLNVGKDGVEPAWTSDVVLVNHYNTCVHRDGFLYGVNGRQEHGAQLQCAEVATGKSRWIQPGFRCASLILADGRLWMFKENGELVAAEANPDSFKPLGSASLFTGVCRAHPALAEGQLYAKGPSELVRVDLRRK